MATVQLWSEESIERKARLGDQSLVALVIQFEYVFVLSITGASDGDLNHVRDGGGIDGMTLLHYAVDKNDGMFKHTSWA